MKLKHLFFITTLFLTSFAHARSKGIGNLLKATTGIYRGARPISQADMQDLKDLKINNILNLQGGDKNSKIWKYIYWNEPGENIEYINAEKSMANYLEIGFKNTPLNSLDPVTSDEDKSIDEALAFMHDPQNKPIYVHCEHGIDRTGLVIALYKIKYEGVSVHDAYREWVLLGHDKLSQIFTENLDDYFFEKVKEFGN